jgi:lipopolysaccharide export system permease protein
LNLRNGWRYEENGNRLTTNTEFIRLGFKEYKKILDLSSFTMNRTDDSMFRNNYQMLSLRQLNKMIDSLERSAAVHKKKNNTDLKTFLDFPKYLDSNWNELKTPVVQAKNFIDWLPDSTRRPIVDRAVVTVNSVKSTIESNSVVYDALRRDLRFHLIAWHEKFTMAIACIVLFLIGAPLGSIIRKGGIGTPLVFAVVFFVLFFLLNNFGKKFVKEDVLIPAYGMWLATIILLPVGIFLVYKAMHDSQLFNKEFYYRVFRKLKWIKVDEKK